MANPLPCLSLVLAIFLLFGEVYATLPKVNSDEVHTFRGRVNSLADGYFIVAFKDDVVSAMDETFINHGVTKVRHLGDNMAVYQAQPDSELDILADTIQDDIKFIEPDWKVYTTQCAANNPNDPSWTSQSAGLWGLRTVNMCDAWSKRVTGKSDVMVAVVDTGADLSHPDLAAAIGWNYNAIAPGTPATDDNGHGSHTAGTIGAIGNNGIGVVGVNQNVKLMPCKFLNSRGSGYTSDAITCIKQAYQAGARIFSHSWGGGGYSKALEDAMNLGNDVPGGVLHVSAAGNGAVNNDVSESYPANYVLAGNNVNVAVASMEVSGDMSSFSQYGATKVHIAAPGGRILSTYMNGAYATLSGTSMATPHVSGAAALLKSVNPKLTAKQIANCLQKGTVQSPLWTGKVAWGGYLSVAGSVACAQSSLCNVTNCVECTPNDLNVCQVCAKGFPLVNGQCGCPPGWETGPADSCKKTCKAGCSDAELCDSNGYCVIDYCAVKPAPCQNGGKCVSGPQGYKCNCAKSWTGPTCENQLPVSVELPVNGDFLVDFNDPSNDIATAGWKANSQWSLVPNLFPYQDRTWDKTVGRAVVGQPQPLQQTMFLDGGSYKLESYLSGTGCQLTLVNTDCTLYASPGVKFYNKYSSNCNVKAGTYDLLLYSWTANPNEVCAFDRIKLTCNSCKMDAAEEASASEIHQATLKGALIAVGVVAGVAAVAALAVVLHLRRKSKATAEREENYDLAPMSSPAASLFKRGMPQPSPTHRGLLQPVPPSPTNDMDDSRINPLVSPNVILRRFPQDTANSLRRIAEEDLQEQRSISVSAPPESQQTEV